MTNSFPYIIRSVLGNTNSLIDPPTDVKVQYSHSTGEPVTKGFQISSHIILLHKFQSHKMSAIIYLKYTCILNSDKILNDIEIS